MSDIIDINDVAKSIPELWGIFVRPANLMSARKANMIPDCVSAKKRPYRVVKRASVYAMRETQWLWLLNKQGY